MKATQRTKTVAKAEGAAKARTRATVEENIVETGFVVG